MTSTPSVKPSTVEAGPRQGRASVGLWMPGAAFLTWWITCFTMYLLQWPIAYEQVNLTKVSLLFGATTAGAWAGYRIGINACSPVLFSVRSKFSSALIPMLGLACTIALFIPVTRAYSGFDVSEMGLAFGDQAGAYSEASSRIAEGFSSRSTVVIAQTLLAPLTLVAVPYFALAWFQERRHLWPFLIAVSLPIVSSMLVGRDQQIGITMIMVAVGWLVSRYSRGLSLTLGGVVAGTALAVSFLFAFGARKLERTAGLVRCPPGSAECAGAAKPSLLDGSLTIFGSYATQGLEGLGRALEGTWHFGGGLSHSPALSSFFQLGSSNEPTVTDQLIYHGWSPSGYWSTALTSLANDIPWPLVPIVIGLQAALLGLSWRSAIAHTDWLSVSVFGYTWIAMLYVPMNLQLAISGPLYIGYLALAGIFTWRRAKSNRTHREGQRSRVSCIAALGRAARH